jgi:hypothetical protein
VLALGIASLTEDERAEFERLTKKTRQSALFARLHAASALTGDPAAHAGVLAVIATPRQRKRGSGSRY